MINKSIDYRMYTKALIRCGTHYILTFGWFCVPLWCVYLFHHTIFKSVAELSLKRRWVSNDLNGHPLFPYLIHYRLNDAVAFYSINCTIFMSSLGRIIVKFLSISWLKWTEIKSPFPLGRELFVWWPGKNTKHKNKRTHTINMGNNWFHGNCICRMSFNGRTLQSSGISSLFKRALDKI